MLAKLLPVLPLIGGATRFQPVYVDDVAAAVVRTLGPGSKAAGKTFEIAGEDLQARVWQHECDHLQGKLILDYMDEAGRIANRRIIKQLEASFEA